VKSYDRFLVFYFEEIQVSFVKESGKDFEKRGD